MKRNQTWNRLEKAMGEKRTRQEGQRIKKKGSNSPHEIIVQRLASEADNKQTYKPIQPREFVPYKYEEFTLANLKKACAEYFSLAASTCDILVSNKGPSCTNISQITHRKDKVYLVRFVLQKDLPPTENTDSDEEEARHEEPSDISLAPTPRLKDSKTVSFPASISISALLKAGKLVKPKPKKKTNFTFEKFDLDTKMWIEVTEEEVNVDTEKFSSGAFRDAFHAVSCNSKRHWVLKTYNAAAIKTIVEDTNSTIEDHCRKQVQMHAVASHLAKVFQLDAPPNFQECFSYNECFFTKYEGQAATIEEYVPGAFAKLVNNNGECIEPAEDASPETCTLYAKAQCLVHFTYHYSNKQLMLTDIQGSNYKLYDPEISTLDIVDGESEELYFCCGNCSSIGIETFLKSHMCNKFCVLMGLDKNDKSSE